jgi:photosystem II stability/assembly factor-like uncharacterized protein
MNIWAGNLRHAVSKSSDNGLSWDNYNTGMESLYNRTMSVHPEGNSAIAATYTGLYTTNDSGNNWMFSLQDELTSVSQVFQSTLDPNTLYAAGIEEIQTYYGIERYYKIIKSIDHGQSWSTILDFNSPYSSIRGVGIDGDNLIVRTYEGYGYNTVYSYNGGQSWDYYYSEYLVMLEGSCE